MTLKREQRAQQIWQVLVSADQTLTIELLPGEQDPWRFAGFSGAKRTYLR